LDCTNKRVDWLSVDWLANQLDDCMSDRTLLCCDIVSLALLRTAA